MADPQSPDEWLRLARQHEVTALAVVADREAAAQAYFHAGLAVECALKAYIMRVEGLTAWPERHVRDDLYTHNLWELLAAAGLALESQGERRSSWRVVLQWQRAESYDPTPMPRKVARSMFEAAFGEKGAVTWIRRILA